MTTNPDTWTTRDLPVLRAVARLLEDDRTAVASDEIASAVGLDKRDVVKALRLLGDEHIRIDDMSSLGPADYVVTGITTAGLRTVGQWPSPETAVDRMIEALEQMIDNTPEGSPKQSRLKASLAWIRDTGRDVMVEVAAAAITGRLPT